APERVFSQLRSRNLLLIGCPFSDWLSRFFVRLSNSERLFSDQRTKKEFLVGLETPKDDDFTRFLQRFSRDSSCYLIDAREFVGELFRRWAERNPQAEVGAGIGAESTGWPPGGTPGAIFISYASDDVGAARALCADLEEIGGDVAWF